MAVGLDRQFKSLAQVLEIPELGDSPRYRSNADRLENRAKLREVLQRRLNAKPRDEWLALLETHGVPAAPINSLGEALQDPVVQERMLVTIDGSPQVRSAIRIDGDPLPVYAAPPSLGEDNLEIRTAVRGADGKLDGSR